MFHKLLRVSLALVFFCFVVLLIGLIMSVIIYSTNKMDFSSHGITSDQESIHIATILSRQVTIPAYNITFSVPQELRTGQELNSSIQNNNDAGSLITLYRADTNYTKDGNGYDAPDNLITFSVDDPYGIHGYTDGLLDNISIIKNSLLPAGSILSQRAVHFTTSADQHVEPPNSLESDANGNVRLDITTPNHSDPTIGILYHCYDRNPKYKNEQLCENTFKMFLMTLRLRDGSLNSPPPTYSESNVFSLIAFKKRQFDPEKTLISYPNFKPVTIPYYNSAANNEEFLSKNDQALKVMSCMPDQIFLNKNNTTYSTFVPGSGKYISVTMTDPVLVGIVTKLQAKIPHGFSLSQFLACETGDNQIVIKYDQIADSQKESDFATDQIFQAKIALENSTGAIQDIASIPNKNLSCSHPLELTTDNILYFECSTLETNSHNVAHNNAIYKINLSTHSYSLLSTCNFPLYMQTSGKYCQ